MKKGREKGERRREEGGGRREEGGGRREEGGGRKEEGGGRREEGGGKEEREGGSKGTREGGREGKAFSCTCFSFNSPTSSSSAHGCMGLSGSRAAPPTAPGRLGHFQCEESALGSLSGLHLRIP